MRNLNFHLHVYQKVCTSRVIYGYQTDFSWNNPRGLRAKNKKAPSLAVFRRMKSGVKQILKTVHVVSTPPAESVTANDTFLCAFMVWLIESMKVYEETIINISIGKGKKSIMKEVEIEMRYSSLENSFDKNYVLRVFLSWKLIDKCIFLTLCLEGFNDEADSQSTCNFPFKYFSLSVTNNRIYIRE